MGFRNNAHSLVLCTFQDTVQRGCRPELNFTVLLYSVISSLKKSVRSLVVLTTTISQFLHEYNLTYNRAEPGLKPIRKERTSVTQFVWLRAWPPPAIERPGRQCSPALIVLDVLLFESLSTSSIRCLPESSLLCFPFPSGYLPSSLSLHTPLPYYFALCHSSINIFYNIYMFLFVVQVIYTPHISRKIILGC